jgi:hypothetical protein
MFLLHFAKVELSHVHSYTVDDIPTGSTNCARPTGQLLVAVVLHLHHSVECGERDNGTPVKQFVSFSVICGGGASLVNFTAPANPST